MILMQNAQNDVSDKNNTADIELDNFAITSGYNQMIYKPTHYINESSS